MKSKTFCKKETASWDGVERRIGADEARLRQARQVARDLGHIDFNRPETSMYLYHLEQGENEHGEPATVERWIEMFETVNNFDNKYSQDEIVSVMLEYAQFTFSQDGRAPNQELLDALMQKLDRRGKRQKNELEASSVSSDDPLAGTEYEGLEDENLFFGQSIIDSTGNLHNPGDKGYRQAFLASL